MIVYFGVSGNEATPAPEPAIKKLREYDVREQLIRCPAFTDFYRNVFLVYPTYDYSFKYDREAGTIYSSEYDEVFFQKFINIRDFEAGDIGYRDPQIYFTTPENSLLMESVPLPAYPFNKPYSLVPGVYDIAKHVRPLEAAFIFKQSEVVEVRRADPLYCVRFNTSEKIQLKRFFITEEFQALSDSVLFVRMFTKSIKPLSYYYDLVKKHNIKKRLFKEIQANLMD